MQALIIVVTSVMASLLVVVFYDVITSPAVPIDPIIGIGMVFPMAVVTGTIFYFFSKRMNENTSKLMNAIKAVSSGNYRYKLDATNGPFQTIFQDFNKMTDELAGVETLRNEFVNKFSHEFKTPIASISGFADLILRGNLSPEDEQQYLEDHPGGIEAARRLIHRLPVAFLLGIAADHCGQKAVLLGRTTETSRHPSLPAVERKEHPGGN